MTGVAAAGAGAADGLSDRCAGSTLVTGETVRTGFGILTLACGKASEATEDCGGGNSAVELPGSARGGGLVSRPGAFPPGCFSIAGSRLPARRFVRAGVARAARRG